MALFTTLLCYVDACVRVATVNVSTQCLSRAPDIIVRFDSTLPSPLSNSDYAPFLPLFVQHPWSSSLVTISSLSKIAPSQTSSWRNAS